MTKLEGVIADLGVLEKNADEWSDERKVLLVENIISRLEQCAGPSPEEYAQKAVGSIGTIDDTSDVLREKALIRAYEAIAAGIEGIRSELAKAREQRNVLPPFDSECGMRVKT